jgi:hypothetical protein
MGIMKICVGFQMQILQAIRKDDDPELDTLFLYCGGPISWVSRLQSTVAQSTCEAEYISAASAAKEAIWLRYLFQYIDPVVVENPILMAVDNQSALALIEHPASHQRTKHIDVQYHFVRQSQSRDHLKFS